MVELLSALIENVDGTRARLLQKGSEQVKEKFHLCAVPDK